jgi:hypothetical protein
VRPSKNIRITTLIFLQIAGPEAILIKRFYCIFVAWLGHNPCFKHAKQIEPVVKFSGFELICHWIQFPLPESNIFVSAEAAGRSTTTGLGVDAPRWGADTLVEAAIHRIH